MAQRRLARRIIMELIIIIVLVTSASIFEYVVEPTQRGFFCDDDTIRYPFVPNSISLLMLVLLTIALPLCCFITVEVVRYRRCVSLNTSKSFSWRMPLWIVIVVQEFCYFSFGYLLAFNATEIGKFTIGRLRPHFMAVCQPQFTDGSTCADPQNLHRYVENYYCAAEGFSLKKVREARLSFPSGHSSLTFYALVYMALYLQCKFSWSGSVLLRHILQFLLIMVAWYTSLTRVMDFWHHWSDVLVGSLIGVSCALITAHYIAKFFKTSYTLKLGGSSIGGGCSGLRREDTTATLEEECGGTPPPYINDEEYCTKV